MHKSNSPILRINKLKKSYGAINAVDDVSLEVADGQILGVIGPNGSGKTTLFNSILGQIKPDSGQVIFLGKDISTYSPVELNKIGIGRTFQSLQVFSKLSVKENLIAAGQEHVGTIFNRFFGPSDCKLSEKVDELIDFFRIRHVADLPAGSLSYGQQKLVDIAMAFMSNPKLILLDEPCAGVNPTIINEIATLLKESNAKFRNTFIVIEHNMDFVMNLCHKIVVMADGKILAEGEPKEIRSNKNVLDAYLGSEDD